MNRSSSNTPSLARIAAAAALGVLAAGATLAQGPNYLATYSQPETTLSGSGGTVLQQLRPNEIAYLDFVSGPCTSASAEKWLPRTAAHVMAGDENADGVHFNPTIFGRIDALLAGLGSVAGIGGDTQRTAFWSVQAPMGNNISAGPFRPGDVARIVRDTSGDGQVEYFMSQDQFVAAMGMPAGTPIDIDAVAFTPNYGVWFSIDSDTPASLDCGPTLVRDGDVLCVPPWGLSYTPDLRIASVVPFSAVRVYTENQMDAFTANAQVTDRFGACLSNVIDVESLEIDQFGPSTFVTACTGITIPTPSLLYSCETGTGASVLTTAAGGQIHNAFCGAVGTSCGSGPTFGPQFGIRPSSTLVGAPSFVNALSFARGCDHVLEPQQHVMNVFPAGAPAGANMIDYNNPFVLSLILIELVSPVVPTSVSVPPGVSPTCFPDLYALSITPWLPVPNGFGSFPMPAIPPLFTGKVLFQGVGFGSGFFELSTPCVIDVQ